MSSVEKNVLWKVRDAGIVKVYPQSYEEYSELLDDDEEPHFDNKLSALEFMVLVLANRVHDLEIKLEKKEK